MSIQLKHTLRVVCLGSGDAFGTGGKLQSCFYVDAPEAGFIVDCGASALISIRKFDLDPNGVRTIFITHLHGDHFGGLPFFLLDAQFVSRRTRPLTIAGPPGLKQRLHEAQEVLFPGSSGLKLRFQLEVLELQPEMTATVDGIRVTPFVVKHSSGAPPFSFRFNVGEKILAWSGDTEWLDSLVQVAQGADLFVCECYTYDKKVPNHIDFVTLQSSLPEARVKCIVLTHMSADMIGRNLPDIYTKADDGLVLPV